MRYYKVTDENGSVLAIGTADDDAIIENEITEYEYSMMLTEILDKANYVEQVAAGDMLPDDIREDWREEIIRRAQERMNAPEDEIPDSEVIAALLEVINGDTREV